MLKNQLAHRFGVNYGNQTQLDLIILFKLFTSREYFIFKELYTQQLCDYRNCFRKRSPFPPINTARTTTTLIHYVTYITIPESTKLLYPYLYSSVTTVYVKHTLINNTYLRFQIYLVRYMLQLYICSNHIRCNRREE